MRETRPKSIGLITSGNQLASKTPGEDRANSTFHTDVRREMSSVLEAGNSVADGDPINQQRDKQTCAT